MNASVYVNFGGNCRDAFQFYEKLLGGTITAIMTGAQMPGAPPNGEMHDKVIYASLQVGSTVIQGSDAPRWQPMRSAYICLDLDSAADVDRIFTALGAGGEVFMKNEETFFAHRFAMLRDRFGVNWMLVNRKTQKG